VKSSDVDVGGEDVVEVLPNTNEELGAKDVELVKGNDAVALEVVVALLGVGLDEEAPVVVPEPSLVDVDCAAVVDTTSLVLVTTLDVVVAVVAFD